MRWLKATAQVSAVASLLALAACTKSGPKADSPEAALEAYVHTAFNAKSVDDGKKLLELSTGEAQEWLSSLSQEAFKKQFVDNHMVLESLKTKDKVQEQNGDVSLVYELAFKDGRGPEPLTTDDKAAKMTPSPAVYTVKKIAYLTKDKESNTWKIRATKNIKSFVERKDALEILTPETTDKNPAADKK
jgi:hypothetical protein